MKGIKFPLALISALLLTISFQNCSQNYKGASARYSEKGMQADLPSEGNVQALEDNDDGIEYENQDFGEPASNSFLPPLAATTSEGWTLVFEDSGTNTSSSWKSKWFLDGKKNAKVKYTNKGLLFKAGKGTKNKHHAVLWAKPLTTGDVKVEYDFVRKDKYNDFVNILFLQASGLGGSYPPDISTWKRKVAKYSLYHSHMSNYSISYANVQNEVRSRTNPGLNINDPIYKKVDLFKRGELHHIVVTKIGKQITMNVTHVPSGKSVEYSWQASSTVLKGHIGLRHMGKRASYYKNFKIYQR